MSRGSAHRRPGTLLTSYGSQGVCHSLVRVDRRPLREAARRTARRSDRPVVTVPLRCRRVSCLLIAAMLGVPLVAVASPRRSSSGRRVPPRAARRRRSARSSPTSRCRLSTTSPPGVADGRRPVPRFTAAIGNVGRGPFIVHAVRADERGDWRVSQRFRERDGPVERARDARRPRLRRARPRSLARRARRVLLAHAARLRRDRPERTRRSGTASSTRPLLIRRPPTRRARAGRSAATTATPRSTLELEMGLSPGWSRTRTTGRSRSAPPRERPRRRRLPALGQRRPGGTWFREARATTTTARGSTCGSRSARAVSPPRVEVVRPRPAGASPGRSERLTASGAACDTAS